MSSRFHRVRDLVAAQSPDHELLQRFAASGDNTAFSTLVDRYGPMVMRVCRHRLGNLHAAEDAFQATFLVLARKVSSIRPETLGCWLHGVATRVARVPQTTPQPLADLSTVASPGADPGADLALREARAVLDEELNQLPEKYRYPLILCYLEEKTRDEAAQQLGWPEGTFKKRLEKGRELLRWRLQRRGVTLSAGLLLTLFGSPASAVVPPQLKQVVVQNAVSIANGKALSDIVPASINQQAMIALGGGKHKLMAALAVMLSGVAIGLAVLQSVQDNKDTSAATKASSDRPSQLDRQGEPLPTGAQVRLGTLRFRHAGWVNEVAWSPDSARVATSSYDGTIRFWDAGSGKELDRHPGRHITMSPDGKTWATWGGDERIILWDAATAQPT
ncbi:MAG: sigma-70 family RNA polymerase sigma factor, partial [Gemmataceae bacterium]